MFGAKVVQNTIKICFSADPNFSGNMLQLVQIDDLEA